MNQHPIPQNVTQYQFKLIGFMTLKQFGMLGAFLLLAFLTTKLPLIPSIFKWPIAVSFALLGFATAFVPYEERTLDIWLINFIKSIYSPTQFVWKKHSIIPSYFSFTSNKSVPKITPPIKKQPLIKHSLKTNPKPQDKWDQIQEQQVQKLTQLFHSKHSYQPNDSDKNTKPENKTVKTTSPAGNIPRTIKSPPTKKQIQNVLFQNQIKLAQNQKETKGFEDQLASEKQNQVSQTIENNISPQKKTGANSLKINKAPNLSPPMEIKSLYPDDSKRNSTTPKFLSDTNMPISPNAPNIIVGMTLSKDEKLIDNAIVEISDKNNIPVRAVKSNKLGQFFIATPIKNGIYKISVEHPGCKFDTIKLEARGEIIPPLKIVATT